MAERLIAPVLKTGRPKGLVSSNLTPSALCEQREAVLVGEGLYLASRNIGAVYKPNALAGIQRNVSWNHIKGVGKIQSIYRLDEVPGYVVHVNAAAARCRAGVSMAASTLPLSKV